MESGRRALLGLAAGAALLLSAGRASAEEERGVHWRTGVTFEGGPLIMPGVVTTGALGVQAQFGAQFNKLVALYLEPTSDFVVGKWFGVTFAAAVLVELTFKDTISVGVGPELGYFVGFDVSRDYKFVAGGILRGGRLHIAWYPEILRGESEDHHPKWGAFSVDVRLLGGAPSFLAGSRSAGPFVLSPMFGIGLQYF